MAFNIKNKQSAIKIILPHTFSAQTMYQVLDHIVDDDMDSIHADVQFDFSKLTIIGSGGVVILSNAIEFLKKSRAEVTFLNLRRGKSKSFHNLKKYGFLKKYVSATEILPISRDTLPLILVSRPESLGYINNRVVPWLGANINVAVERIPTLKVCLEEIFNNIVDHSTVDIACCCASHHQQHGKVRICISDFGVGIPTTARRFDPSLISDENAIFEACRQGFSAKSNPGNMGIGLYVLVQNVVAKHKGQLDIYSGSGIVNFSHILTTDAAEPRLVKSNSFYPGTFLSITLDVDKIVPEEIEEEFTW